MSGPIRYAWGVMGMRPSETQFGATRYINEHDHDNIVAYLREALREIRGQVNRDGHVLKGPVLRIVSDALKEETKDGQSTEG